MASVPRLLDALCEAVVPAGGRGPRARRSLRRAAYEALLAPLFPGAARRARLDARLDAGLPARNRALMLAFDLRVAGLRHEAERLEELLAELAALPGEPGAALELLVLLAGSGPPRAPRPRRDPLAGGGRQGRAASHGGYDCLGLSERERDVRAALCREELRGRDSARASLRAMDAAPGSGLSVCGRAPGAEPGFERDTRGSLFGALVHSRTWDMDVRLDLPPVPDGADLSGLTIKVPHSVDQSEDEGFQSASNLTPDSQSELGLTPDLDLWDAALTYQPSRRRCWEQIGRAPGNGEEPYLTEAGRDAFDHFRRLHHEELRALGGGLLDTPPPVLVGECELVKDVLNVLIGVLSATFSLCQLTQAFVVTRGTHVSGASPESISSLLAEVAACGTHYMRLSRFSLQPALGTSCSRGLVFQAFTSGLRRYLQYYRACVLATPPSLSLLTIGFLFKKLGRQLRYLAELCGVGTVPPAAGGGEPRAPFPTGVKLLSYLYQEALDNCSNEHYPVLLSLLKTSCEPYTRFIHDWVYSGVFRDACGEFMIQVNDDYLGFRDRLYWTHGYVLISKEVEDCVPVFLKDIAHDVYVCGKTINLLKLCCPRHYLCWSEVPVPRISVLFSPQELRELQKACALYVGRMERVARHSSVSKEQQELRMEIAKQELIIHAWEAASRVLRELSDRQVSGRKALDAQKREQFQKLKEQFVKDQERRRAARQEELDDDFSYARELRDREKRLRALEEQMERKARQALVEHYSTLSAEAARREQRALWRVQRHRLASARLRFLSEDEKYLQGLLQDMAEAQEPPKPSRLPEPQVFSPGGGPGSEQAVQQLGAVSGDLSGLSPASPELASGGTYSSGPKPDSGPFSEDLSIGDFLPAPGSPEQPPCTAQAPVLEEALQTIGSELPLSPGPPGPPDYDFRTVLRPVLAASASPGSLQTVGSSLNSAGDGGDSPQGEPGGPGPGGQVAECVHHLPGVGRSQQSQDLGQLLGHSLGARSVKREDAAVSTPSQPRGHGHVSDASVKVGEHVWDVAPSQPRGHGHVSDASIRVGEHVWDVAPSQPRGHGHVSDASVKVGEHVWDIAPSRPRWNVHGHVSDASVKVGEHVWDVAPSRPRWNVHGHVSQSQVSLGVLSQEVQHERPVPLGNPCEGESPGPGPLNPDPGAPISEQGAPLSDLGAQRPDPGTPDPDQGAQCPDPGTPDPDQGAQCPDPGAPILDTGTLSPDRGSPVLDLGALGPGRGAQVPADSPWVQAVGCREEAVLEALQGAVGDGAPEDPGKTSDTEDIVLGRPPSSQGGPDAQSSPDLGQRRQEQEEQEQGAEEAEAAAVCREQAYIKSLAGRYRLEQYPDSFASLSEPPVARLLHHGLPQACAHPEGPREQPTAEPTVQLSELLPLPVLMKHSLTAPLAAHISLVNKAAVDYFFVELRLEAHLDALRHFLLMEDGEFAQSLSDLLFEKLGAGQTPGELLTPLVLNSLLSKALQFSLHGHSPLADNLSFALKFLPDAFAPNAPDVLSCLELRYKVDWPLNLVVTESCLGRYSSIFSFLLQLKLMMWTLKDVCFHLKRTALQSQVAGSVQFRQLQLFKHEMQHFVKVIQGYVASQILHVTWSEFRARLATVRDLEEVQRAHAEYLHKAVFRGLLTEKAAPVMNIIHSLFSLVLKFRSQLISQPWGPARGPRGAQHPNFALMQQSYNTFKYYSHFLFKVVTKLVNRGYQPHLEDFLLRINFNNYYQDTRAGQ